ncbi:hypothetical protein [Stutzerimonas degradans]|uniref:Uncharacterized protein n=1 Tax=Stutzerimonas degradans TaxID=2968968 RepID=A0A8E2U2M6_9GAMM|nr:hypothetical protein [Stutzerimonas degradans]MCQ4274506.1 hypothetical protein [Stutzerimonas degradans]PNF77937.1 hypothetical protein CXK95_01180 [Stutzerimonas degradans]QPT23332.1 hypothetical protein I6G33_08790 [Stutzerimonas degradans]
MTTPIMLGGIPLELHSGAPVLSEEPIGGETSLRMSDGALVSMTHWERMSGSISGAGWMPPGLHGLDYSQPLELRSTKVQSIAGAGLVHTVRGTPRPDVAPWGQALVGGAWVNTACNLLDGVATLAAVAGATLYRVCWMPVYSVKARRPSETQDSGTASHSWSITWEET